MENIFSVLIAAIGMICVCLYAGYLIGYILESSYLERQLGEEVVEKCDTHVLTVRTPSPGGQALL